MNPDKGWLVGGQDGARPTALLKIMNKSDMGSYQLTISHWNINTICIQQKTSKGSWRSIGSEKPYQRTSTRGALFRREPATLNVTESMG